MLKIRLRRMGSRHRPFYRLVVSDSRRTPRARAVDEVGFYDPRAEPPRIEIDGTKVDHWVGKGAQMSPTVSRLVKSL
jgi:small subunit ribosomal protein S16